MCNGLRVNRLGRNQACPSVMIASRDMFSHWDGEFICCLLLGVLNCDWGNGNASMI